LHINSHISITLKLLKFRIKKCSQLWKVNILIKYCVQIKIIYFINTSKDKNKEEKLEIYAIIKYPFSISNNTENLKL